MRAEAEFLPRHSASCRLSSVNMLATNPWLHVPVGRRRPTTGREVGIALSNPSQRRPRRHPVDFEELLTLPGVRGSWRSYRTLSARLEAGKSKVFFTNHEPLSVRRAYPTRAGLSGTQKDFPSKGVRQFLSPQFPPAPTRVPLRLVATGITSRRPGRISAATVSNSGRSSRFLAFPELRREASEEGFDALGIFRTDRSQDKRLQILHRLGGDPLAVDLGGKEIAPSSFDEYAHLVTRSPPAKRAA